MNSLTTAARQFQIYDGARDNAGRACVATFDQLADGIAAERNIERQDKRALPAFGPYLLQGVRANANVRSVSWVVFDVDNMPEAQWEATRAKLSELSCFWYGSPSDRTTPGLRKVRVVVETDRPMAPHELNHVRDAIGSYAGIAQDSAARDECRIYFLGKLPGSPDREYERFHGQIFQVDAFLKLRPAPSPATPRARAVRNESDGETAGHNHDAVVTLLAPYYVKPHKHDIAYGLAGYYANRGYTQWDAVRVVDGLPSDEPDDRAKDARDAFNAETPAGYSKLSKCLPAAVLAQLEALIPERGAAAEWASNHSFPSVAGVLPPAQSERTYDPYDFTFYESKEHESIAFAVQRLADSPNVYQRAGALVHLARDLAPNTKVERPADAPRIKALTAPRLKEELGQLVNWFRYDTKKERSVRSGVPMAVPLGVMARGEWYGVRKLEGLVESPIVRPDGSIASAAGYDLETGVYITSTVEVQTAGIEPAASARELLDDIVGDFPFAGPEHKSAFLAALLTPIARYAFKGAVPLILLDKNQPGSGGSLLADLVGIICTGCSELPRTSQADDEAEETKRLLGLAKAGDPIVLIDNVNRPLGNAALDRVLTGTVIRERLLGVNDVVTAPWNCMLLASGNNIQLIGDTVRRALHVRLDSRDENPENRTGFRHTDLKAYVLQNRGRILSVLLRVLQAHLIATDPLRLKPWGSFEEWSRVVRGAIVRAGLPDPLESRREIIANDSDKDRARAIIQGLWALGATSEATAMYLKALVPQLPANMVTGPNQAHVHDPRAEALAGLRSALEDIDPNYDMRKLGNAFRLYKGRVVDQLRLVGTKGHAGFLKWHSDSVQL